MKKIYQGFLFSVLTVLLTTGCVMESISGSGSDDGSGAGGGNDNSSQNYDGCTGGQGIGTNSIQVDFAFPDDASRIVIKRDGNQIASFSNPDAPTANPTTYTDINGLREGATYLYTCEALFDGLFAEGDQSQQLSTLAVNAPAGFTGIDSASVQSPTEVLVTWTPTIVDIPVSAFTYEIFANPGLTVDWTAPARQVVPAGSTAQATLTGLGDDLDYSFGVRACSEGGVCETNMVQQTVTTTDGGAPTTAGATGVSIVSSKLEIIAPWSEAQGGIVRRIVYSRTGPTGGTNLADYTVERTYDLTGSQLYDPPTTLEVSPLVEGTTYHIIVQDEDPQGQRSAVTSFQTISANDITGPSFGGITNLILGSPQDSVVTLSFTAIDTEAIDPINGGDKYRVLMLSDTSPISSNPCTDGSLVQELNVSDYTSGNNVNFDLDNPTHGVTEKMYYKVCVKAIDLAGNLSSNNNSLQINTLDITPPSFSGIQSLAFNNQTGNLDVGWNASGSTDIKEYRLTIWVNQPTPPGSPTNVIKSHADSPTGAPVSSIEFTLADNDEVYVIVEACDSTEVPFGTQNCTSTGIQRSVVVPDVTAPPNFLGISGPTELDTLVEGEIVVKWNAPADWSDYRGFRIYQVDPATSNLTLLKTCACVDYGCTDQITQCTLNGLDAFRTYRLHVRAFDEALNETSYLNPATNFTDKRTIDTTAPTFASNLVIGASPIFDLSWNQGIDNQYASEPGSEITYRVYQNNAPFDFSNPVLPNGNLKTATQDLDFTDSGFVEAQTYYYTICAVDASGNTTCDQLTRNFTVPDVTLPVITNLVSNKTVKGKVWELSWTMNDNISATNDLFVEIRRNISVNGDPATESDQLIYSGLGSTLAVSGDDMSTTQPASLDPLSGSADLDRKIDYLVVVTDEEGNKASSNVTIDSNNSVTVSSVKSVSGPVAGGTLIAVYGTGFTKASENVVGVDSEVLVAGQPCGSAKVLSENAIYCTTPAGSVAGSVEVRVRNQVNDPAFAGNREYSEAALNNGFTYNAVPALCDDPGSWDVTFAAGTGTNLDPYIICDDTHLDNVRTISSSGANFKMGASVDLNSISMDPLGNATSKFEGNFDGDGHMILNWTYSNPAQANIGIFGYVVGDFQISNLGIVDADITANQSIGGLMGVVEGGVNKTGLISNVYVTGSLTGDDFIGGLIGRKQGNHSNFNVIDSYFVGDLTVNGITGYGGGIAGFLGSDTGGFFQSVYSEGTVDGSKVLGGLFGNLGENKQVLDSFSRSVITGTGNVIGGLAGEVKTGALVSNSFVEGGSVSGDDSVGGLVGLLEGDITGSNSIINVTSVGQKAGGLVGAASAGSITDSNSSSLIVGVDSVGGLVGELSSSDLTNSFATGPVTASGTNAGGLIGRVVVSAGITSAINKAYATGLLTITSSGAGGLIGFIETLSTGTLNVSEVFSSSQVGDDFGIPSQQFGGLIGKANLQNNSNVNLSNCYSSGDVFVGSYGGGLLGGYDFTGGTFDISYCYSSSVVNGGASLRGGVFGRSDAALITIDDTYWDSVVSTQSFASGDGGFTGTVTPHTTAEMQDYLNSIYVGWDFSSVWAEPVGGGYPVLQFAQ